MGLRMVGVSPLIPEVLRGMFERKIGEWMPCDFGDARWRRRGKSMRSLVLACVRDGPVVAEEAVFRRLRRML